MSDEGGGARFSLPAGEGAGTMLGLAAGDTAGGACPEGYSSPTQQAVVVAYHLFRHGRLEREALAAELAELDGDEEDPSVYREISPELRKWLDSMTAADPEYSSELSLDPAVRSVPLGVWFRRQPDELVEAVLEVARVTHLDAPSAVLATALAGAVAGGCFAQNGRDLIMAVTEVAGHAIRTIEDDDLRYAHTDQAGEVAERLHGSLDLVGASSEELGRVVTDPVGVLVAGLALAAPVAAEPKQPVQRAAEIGGSALGAVVGAVMGARVGIRAWPWEFPNDTWFMAIGQRLVEGRTDLVDLPVPYAVEQRVSYSSSHPRV